MENNFTVLVNSSDGFEDCWNPFFTLFRKYWPDYNGRIYLNTELKDYSFEGLNIICTKVNINDPELKLTWSECLIRALNIIDIPLVLYMQEDYFIENRVNNDLINDFSQSMIYNESIKYLGVTDIGNMGPFTKYEHDDRLCVVGNNKYRISTQAALWRKDILLSYLKPDENGWMFEIFGTQRAKNRKELFLTSNRDLYNRYNNPIISYEHTGIIKGKWHKNMPDFFNSEGLVVKFSTRGIYVPKNCFFRKFETIKKLLKSPLKFITSIR